MKAAVTTGYGPPDVVKIKTVETPIPKDNEVLVKIHASTVARSGSLMRSGTPFLARFFLGLTKPKRPIQGTDLAGEIVEIGKWVKKFKVKDKIFAATDINVGGHAEFTTIPENGVLAKMPKNTSYEEAAAIIEGALTAVPFLRGQGKLEKGQEILINGASGSIGTAAVQIAKYMGAKVTGVCSTKNVKLVKSLGADHTIDYTKGDFTKEDKKYDLIFDTVGILSYFNAKKSLKPKGLFLTPMLNGPILWQMISSVFSREKLKFSATGLRPHKDKLKDLIYIKELMEKKKLKSIIDKTYPLDKIVEAYEHVDTGHKVGNVVVTMEHKK